MSTPDPLYSRLDGHNVLAQLSHLHLLAHFVLY